MNNAIWRRFENASVRERKQLVDNDIDNQNFINDTNKSWVVIRDSFRHSPEWREFSKLFLLENRKCERCKKKSEQTHHRTPLTKTALLNGFLVDLKYKKRFEALCSPCHIKEHSGLIANLQALGLK
jgi:5-methylcytosine-specific restriction endonuclease McrA